MQVEMDLRAGEKFVYVCTGNVGYHDLVISNGLVGVASKEGKSGDKIVCEAYGVFALPKPTTGASFEQGTPVYVASDAVTATASGATYVGIAWRAAAETDGVVYVKINAPYVAPVVPTL